MRKVKTSVLAMLSVVALLFSSCLGDSDYAPSIGCTGKPLGSLSADVKLDNGVIVTLSGISATTLMDIDRMYVYGQLTGELRLKSRRDVQEFMRRVRENAASPLSTLTGGIHTHTLLCPDEPAYEKTLTDLRTAGILLE